VKLDPSVLSSAELKDVSRWVEAEQDRRRRKNPANHEPLLWEVPKKAVVSQNRVAQGTPGANQSSSSMSNS
jgi:hypothetical protein